MRDNLHCWIGFNLVKGIGPVRLNALLDAFGNIERAWNASPEQLRECGLSSKLIGRMETIRSRGTFDKILERVDRENVQVLTWESKDYPGRLKEIPQSPPVLYVKGNLIREDEWAVGLVGTRRYSSYGKKAAEKIAGFLARSGVTVVSGLARGIDGIAHQAALDAGGRTIAVLGSGVDHIYPPEHRKLANRILENGAVISDYPLGTQPEGSNFPPRNRIISGLSRAVVVVEAGKRSGALITAQYAAEQGREVFAVPGSIFAVNSLGPNRLIQQGANPLLEPENVLELLEMSHISEFKAARQVLPSNAVEAQLFKALDREPLHVDELSARTQIPVEEVTSTLALMELKGMVTKMSGMKYAALGEGAAKYEAGQEGS